MKEYAIVAVGVALFLVLISTLPKYGGGLLILLALGGLLVASRKGLV